MNLMNTCIRTVLIPLASANVTVRRDMEKIANLALDRMEEKVNSIMQRSIDVVVTWIAKLLARQNKLDFRPRDDASSGGGAWLEQLQTPVSLISEICSSIQALTKFSDLYVYLSIPNPRPQPRSNSPIAFVQSHRLPHRTRLHIPHPASGAF